MAHRTWFVTGVSSGFGRIMTEQLLAEGDRVAGTVRKMDAMSDLKARYNDRLWLAHLDMTDTPAIRRVVDKAFADLGKIDIVVSNAGYGLFGAAEELRFAGEPRRIISATPSARSGGVAFTESGAGFPVSISADVTNPLLTRSRSRRGIQDS